MVSIGVVKQTSYIYDTVALVGKIGINVDFSAIGSKGYSAYWGIIEALVTPLGVSYYSHKYS